MAIRARIPRPTSATAATSGREAPPVSGSFGDTLAEALADGLADAVADGLADALADVQKTTEALALALGRSTREKRKSPSKQIRDAISECAAVVCLRRRR